MADQSIPQDDETTVAACHAEWLSQSIGLLGNQDSRELAHHTTFGIGGPAAELVRATTTSEIVDAVRDADESGMPLMVLSGGSNVLIADEGFDGRVVLVDNHGLDAEVSSCGGALVRAAAGERWDDFVAHTIDCEWAGIEALSGIPGLVGATPVQNVGAYGQEVAQTIARVRTWDRKAGEYRTFTADQCGFSYRDSIFKRSRAQSEPTGRYVVVEVWFQFVNASRSMPIGYSQLAAHLGAGIGDRVDAREVREAVLELRRSKGMVHDPTDPDTRSAGSFFTNPIVPAGVADALPSEAPRFPIGDGRVKSSAAWLIDHAGFGKGFPGAGAARLSSKHVLALTNHDHASAAQVAKLARTVHDGVKNRFGVELVPEPVIVGLTI